MWLALDTATDRASLALGGPGGVAAEAEIVGARRHAAGLLPALERTLAGIGATAAQIEGIVLADGPGSFTGLRVGASVAKALLRVRQMPLWTAPSLLGVAGGAAAAAGETVAGVSDALRGEIFAGAWRFHPGKVEWVLPPAVLTPAEFRRRLGHTVRITGTAAPLLGAGEPSWPRAAALLGLVGMAGGVRLVADPAGWEPDYGRPAEAQAKWEREHGRRLASPTGPAR
jgi:tRNA threonylcarbamoyl adenosine modification protein YeaZ